MSDCEANVVVGGHNGLTAAAYSRGVADLELRRFGHDPIALDPPFATFAADGPPILFHSSSTSCGISSSSTNARARASASPFTRPSE